MSTQTSHNNAEVDFHEFYWLRDGFKSKPMRVVLGAGGPMQQLAIDLSCGYVDPKEPVSVKVAMGREDASFLWSTLPPLLLVADSVAICLQENNITGWRTYPVVLSSMNGRQISGYQGFAVTGRLGNMMPLHETPELMPPGVEGGKSYLAHYGICFDPPKWDQSDICSFSGRSFVVIRRHVMELLKKVRASNVRFQPIDEIATDAFLSDNT